MMLLSLMDPSGTESRKKRRIKRRVYRSKVCLPIVSNVCILITGNALSGFFFNFHSSPNSN